MAEANGRSEDAEEKPRFSQDQYEMLMRCSERKDMTEWNDWRETNPQEVILLEGAALQGAHLEGADLNCTFIEGASFRGDRLEGAHLEGAKLDFSFLEGAKLQYARLEAADVACAHLEGADLLRAHLEGAKFRNVHLEGASFGFAVVDGQTEITGCWVDLDTDFTLVGLGSARIDPGLRQLLEYNIRRKGWEKWYRDGPWWTRILKNALVRPFWWMSDYGRSTGRIAGSFFGLAALFAVVYWLCSGCLEGITKSGPAWQRLLHAFYFSVVTMTTLGFGDIHAAPGSPGGQVLLMVQVLLGYILLAALVTRLAILFTTGGPADTHTPTIVVGAPNGDNEGDGKSSADRSGSDE